VKEGSRARGETRRGKMGENYVGKGGELCGTISRKLNTTKNIK